MIRDPNMDMQVIVGDQKHRSIIASYTKRKEKEEEEKDEPLFFPLFQNI